MRNVSPLRKVEMPDHNWLINGDMKISQRGDFSSASSASNSIYYLDRWRTSLAGISANKQQISTNQPSELSGSKSLKYIATSSASGYVGGIQYIEDVSHLAGKTVTISGWIKSNSVNARLSFWEDAGIWNNTDGHSGNGTWEFFSMTITLNPATTACTPAGRLCGPVSSSVSITSGDYVEFTGMKLEFGIEATGFTPRKTADELQLCQRYYEQSQGLYECGWSGRAVSGANYRISIRHSIEKRIIPSLSLIYRETAGFASSAPSSLGNYKSGFTATKIANSTIDQGYYFFNWIADAEMY